MGQVRGMEKWKERYGEPKKKGETVIQGLDDLNIEDLEAIEQRERQVQEGFIEKIRRDIPKIGEILSDPKRARKQGPDLRSHEEMVVKAIKNQLPEGSPLREEVVVVLMDEMIKHYPADATGLNRIADVGLALDYFQEATDNDPDNRVLALLPSNEDGRGFHREDLVIQYPGTRGHTARIQDKIDKNEETRRTEREQHLEELRDGAAPILAVLETGMGEGFGYAPDKELDDGRFFGGGTLRVEVKNGLLHPVSAVGKCARRFAEVKNILDGENLGLPVETLKQERMELKRRFERPVFLALLTFHDLTRRMWLHETKRKEKIEHAKAEVASFKEAETVEDSPEARLNFLKEDYEKGKVFLYMRSWDEDVFDDDGNLVEEKTHHGVRFLLERNEGGEVRVADCLEVHQDLFRNNREFALLEEQPWPLPKIVAIIKARLERAAEGGEDDDKSDEA